MRFYVAIFMQPGMRIRTVMMDVYRKLIVNRGVILLPGCIAFVATSATLSLELVSIAQLCGFGIYLVCGLLLFRSRTDVMGLLVFFAPFSIWLFVALTDNPGLFPDVVPLLMITCITGYFMGAFLVSFIQHKKLLRAAGLVAAGFMYLGCVVWLLVPAIVFDRLVERVQTHQPLTNKLIFFGLAQDSVVIKSDAISVIDFWFTKCGVCYPNNDFLNVQAAKYKSLGVNFYLVYMGDIDSYREFQRAYKKHSWSNLIPLYDSMSTVSGMLRLEGAPHTLIVSNDMIVYHQSGFGEEAKAFEEDGLNDMIMREVAKNADGRNIFPGRKNTIDLGEIDLKHDSIFTCRLMNTFDKPISVKDVKGSCNCLISSWAKESIAPGGCGSISFSFVPDTASAYAKTIMISTTLPEAPFTVVNLLYRLKVRS